MLNKKQKRRLYRIHRNLSKAGNTVKARSRTVIKRATDVSDKENELISELISFGYAVSNPMFE